MDYSRCSKYTMARSIADSAKMVNQGADHLIPESQVEWLLETL